jgi:hypothetical protein
MRDRGVDCDANGSTPSAIHTPSTTNTARDELLGLLLRPGAALEETGTVHATERIPAKLYVLVAALLAPGQQADLAEPDDRVLLAVINVSARVGA